MPRLLCSRLPGRNLLRVSTHVRRGIAGRRCARAVGATSTALLATAGCGRRAAATYAGQASLPPLPVPTLQETMERYVESVEGILTDKDAAATGMDVQRTRAAVDDFMAQPDGVGPMLQRELEERASAHPNWLEQWWDLGYLELRASLLHVNPLLVFDDTHFGDGGADAASGHTKQIARAARLVAASMQLWQALDSETLPAVKDGGELVCMSQAARMFGHARVPKPRRDELRCSGRKPRSMPEELQHWATRWRPEGEPAPRHVAVLAGGHVFEVAVLDDSYNPLPVATVANTLAAVRDAATSLNQPSHPVPALTAANRDSWAAARASLEEHAEVNAASLASIDAALFVLVLEDVVTPDESGKVFLVGDSTNRWMDKHALIVCRDGTTGMCSEHAPGDGATYMIWLAAMVRGASQLAGHQEASHSADADWRVLEWDVPSDVEAAVDAARAFSTGWASNLHMARGRVPIGTDVFKERGISPDAAVQMAIQLAYVKVFGACAGTYEAASTWRFLHGRTETVRSVTSESNAFVAAALRGASDAEVGKALRTAAQTHVRNARLAKAGRGIDRHLFGLHKLAAARGVSADLFEDPVFAYSSTWRLSTSQVPANMLDVVGFSPVTADGVGVGYLIRPDCVTFNVSSFARTATEAAAPKLIDALVDAAAQVDRALAESEP